MFFLLKSLSCQLSVFVQLIFLEISLRQRGAAETDCTQRFALQNYSCIILFFIVALYKTLLKHNSIFRISLCFFLHAQLLKDPLARASIFRPVLFYFTALFMLCKALKYSIENLLYIL